MTKDGSPDVVSEAIDDSTVQPASWLANPPRRLVPTARMEARPVVARTPARLAAVV